MTNFAHEEYLITHIALGFDNVPLDNTDISNVKVTVYDSAGAVVASANDQPMVWDANPEWSVKVGSQTITGQGWWQYLWDTAAVDPGTYKAKVILTGTTGGKNFEYLRIRLARDPLPVV